MASDEVTVRGGGIFGLACAWELARCGAKVRLIELARIGAGASGGLVGALSPHVPEHWTAAKQFQLDSLLMAENFWRAVEAASGLPTGYGRVGRLQPLADSAALERAEARARAASHLWRGRALWRLCPATGAAWEPPSPTGLLIEDTLSARLHPRLATAALAAALRATGAEILFGEAEERGPVLHATGAAGLADLSTALGYEIGTAQKGQALSLGFAAPEGAPQIYADGLHIVAHVDGSIAIGSTSERDWTDPATTDARLDHLHARAVAALPCLADAPVIARWAGLRPRARQPLLGRWPGRPGHFIANGGFKTGFGLAPAIARAMADLILTGADRIPPDFHLPES
ncbi:MAG: FAD-binding oxidoreductase [Gemmobacter sp.]|jgi:glycine/D-amino acid oxidase-like deaminating enzyme|nr:FAD-binding oxidoreductase [Gemmobacter sp.]